MITSCRALNRKHKGEGVEKRQERVEKREGTDDFDAQRYMLADATS